MSESITWLYSLEDLSAARSWLKISGMYIFPVLWLRAGNLFAVLIYYHEVGDVGSGVAGGNAVFAHTSPGNYSQASNSSASFITASYSK